MSSAQLGNGVKWTSNTNNQPSGTPYDSTAANKANNPISISPKTHLHERKISTPMMPAFMTSAPGKVIVFGEHAVVHGKAAMAASVSLRSYLLVTVLSKTRRTVALRFPDIGFSHVWRIDELPWAIFHSPSKKKFYYDLVTSLDEDLLAAIQPHVEEVSTDLPLEIRKVHKSSATAFLYLFCALGNPSFPGSVYTLRSTIPVGAGLGSSASVAVCLASALLKQLHALSGPHPDQPPDEAALQVERINRWAFVAEMAIHGTPSGVDNTVASGGRAVVFQREDYAKPPVTTLLNKFPELPLLIVDTKHPKNTAVEVAKVHTLRKSQPQVTEAILNAIDRVTESAALLVQNDEFDSKNEDDVSSLGELFQLNHGMLASLGVSHPRLERIKDLVNESGLGWTKLTGAGGGGVAISLLKPSCQRGELNDLEAKLKAEGFEIYDTVLGGDGVGILWPAVLHNGSDEEGGEEIDQEKFLRAEGSDELDRLVGVGIRQKRKDWKYWSL